MKRVPVTLVSPEPHPSPCCAAGGQLSTLVLEPLPMLWFSAWLCLSCGFGMSLSCMWLCMCVHPRGKGFSMHLPSAPVCVCVQGRSSSAPSDPGLAFAGGQREENHSPGCDEAIAAA